MMRRSYHWVRTDFQILNIQVHINTFYTQIHCLLFTWHTFRTPLSMLPPATPPLRSSTSDPGLLTSKDLMTMSLGLEVKSLTGIGIFLERYSQITSMLYLSWAEIGMMGAPSATVPKGGGDGRRKGEKWKREREREREHVFKCTKNTISHVWSILYKQQITVFTTNICCGWWSMLVASTVQRSHRYTHLHGPTN